MKREETNDDFAHLHVHSMASLLDGFPKFDEICKRVKDINQSSVAITDHGTMAGLLRFYQEAQKQGIRPIAGIEAYLVEADTMHDRNKDDHIYHIGILAKNEWGLRNLYKLSDLAWNTGFYKKPRIDYRTLVEHKDGLIILSGCMNGIISNNWLNGDMLKANLYHASFVQDFGPNYYVEIQPWNSKELNEYLIHIADETQTDIVVTADTHYCDIDDKVAEEINLLIQTTGQLSPSEKEKLANRFEDSRTIASSMDKINFLHPDRKLRYDKIDNYLLSRFSLEKKMLAQGIDRKDIYENTVKIAKECDFELDLGKSLFPQYNKHLDSKTYLRELAYDGLKAKNLDKKPEYIARLEEELSIINKLDFADYFLVVWDIIDYAKSHDIMVGPGRGSVAGSLLAYCLGIHKIDPLKYNLLFWRFLNPDRIEFPDIDLDFEDRRRDEIRQYLKDRWDNAANIATFMEFKSKGLIRDLSRVFAIPLKEVNAVTKHFENLEEFLSSKDTLEFRNKYPEITQYAKKFEGRWRSSGVHAAGMVIADRPLNEILPMESRPPMKGAKIRVPVAAYDMEDCAKIGLNKMDFLGISMLSVMSDAVKEIRKAGHDIDIDSISENDPKVLAEFQAGHTVGIFQVGETSYTQLLKKMQIDSFQELYASNALVRPGPLLTVTPTYIKRKKGEERFEYEHESIEKINSETFGLFVYQEQLMEALVLLGDFTWAEADTVRKIIGKKRDAKEFKPFEDKWIQNAGLKLGKARAKKLWSDFEKFSDYAFNKSHAVSYSYMSYQTMWLKVYYPSEFIFALLKNEPDLGKITTYLLEARRLGIEIQLPDINKSDYFFTLEDGKIRYGISTIKGVGDVAAKELIEKRHKTGWASLSDLLSKVEKRAVNKKVQGVLAKVGAFNSLPDCTAVKPEEEELYDLLGFPQAITNDAFGLEVVTVENFEPNECCLMKVLIKNIKYAPHYTRMEIEDSTGAMVLFVPQEMRLDEGRVILCYATNKNLLGFVYYDELETKMKLKYTLNDFEKFLVYGELFDDERKLYNEGVGRLDSERSLISAIAVRKFKTKKGADMATMIVSDEESILEIVLFPQNYAKCAAWIKPFNPLVIEKQITADGTVTIAEDGILPAKELMRRKGLI